MRQIQDRKTEKYDVVFLPTMQKEVVRFKITCDTYSKLLNEHPSLLEQYAEALLSGTKKYTRESIADTLEALGTELTIDHNRISQLHITVTTLTVNLTKTLQILTSVLTEPTFVQKELSRIRKQAVQHMHEDRDDARFRAYTNFTNTVFRKPHPSHIPSIDVREQDTTNIEQSHFAQLHTIFLSNPWKISISAGNTDAESIMHMVDSVKKEPVAGTERMTTPSIRESKTMYTSIPTKENIEVCIGNALPYTQSDARFQTCVFGLAVLGKVGGFSGRLMSIVREKKGLTYGIYARTAGVTKNRTGCWYISTFFTPRDFENGVNATIHEIKRIVTNGVTDAEVDRFKTLIYNQFLTTHESSERMLRLYHQAILGGKTAAELKEDYEKIQHITKKEVNDALRVSFDPHKLVISAAGPTESIKRS